MTQVEAEMRYDIEAERAVLGTLMLHYQNPGIMATIAERIDEPNFFWQPVHRDIFTAILELYNSEKPIDVISVNSWLKENDLYSRVKSINVLNELTEWAYAPSQLPHHVKLVCDAAIRRQLEEFAKKLAEGCRKPGQTVDELLFSAEKGLVKISNTSQGDNTSPLSEIMPEVRKDIEKKKSGEVTGLLTGYKDLDEKTDGFHPGGLIILAARPSVGKSAFALNIAENLIKQSIPVGLISLEMTKLENAKRIMLSRARTPLPGRKESLFKDEDWERIDNTIQQLASAPLYINDQTDMTITRLKSVATKMRLNHKIELLIVDYLQLLSPGRKTYSRNEEVSIISRSLKVLAGNLRIPVLAISQFNRSIEARGEKAKPKLSDLRDSGSLEQDADVVLFLHPKNDSNDNSELIIAKQRNGPRGIINLHFMKEYVRWELGLWRRR